MNAESYLRKQGWKGSGHSLDSTGRGIKKPLLIAHKQDQLGLGKKKAAWTTDDQWWMRAYDQSLQSIGTGKGEDSTLNQIRTKGINRGGLYGFFVKGEAIAGTIEDSSATATDASIPPSGASTPPTSASESEAPAKTAKASDKKNKRKRGAEDAPEEAKEAKKTKIKQSKSGKKGKTMGEGDPVARKIAKLSPSKKAGYEERAAAKGQTIEQYISRRIYKKSALRASTKLNKPGAPESAPKPFFTDLSGDTSLLSSIPALPVPLPIESASASASADESDGPATSSPTTAPKKVKKIRKAHLPSDTPSGKKVYKAMIREKRQEKKEKKKKEQRTEKSTRNKSQWGANKEDSRWGKLKKAKTGVVGGVE